MLSEKKKVGLYGLWPTLATIQVLNDLESRDSGITIRSTIYIAHTVAPTIFTPEQPISVDFAKTTHVFELY